MKKNLCILLALMTAVMMLTSSVMVFASDVEETTDAAAATEAAAEVAEEGAEAVEGETAAEEPAAEAVEEQAAPIQVLEITVNGDGSSTSSLIMPVPVEYESQIDGIVTQYEGMGIATEVIDDYEGFKAIKVSTQRDATQAVNISTPGSESEAFDAWVIDGLFKKTTIMNASYDFAGGYYTEGEEIASVIINLPSKAKNHNAEGVDGTTYTWTLRGGVNNPIRFVMETTTVAGWIALAVIVLLVVLIILSVVISNKKKNGGEEVIEEAADDSEEMFEIAEEADVIEEIVEEPSEAVEEVIEEVAEETEEDNQ